MTDILPRRLLQTDAARAAVTRMWIDGITQKKLASAFGYKNGGPVHHAIEKLIVKYFPDHPTVKMYSTFPGDFYLGIPYDEERKPIAEVAIQRYLESRMMGDQTLSA